MFERFTNRAREAVVRAQNDSRSLRHPSIGCEHLLLALTDPDAGIAHAVLAGAGADRNAVLAAIGRHASPPRLLSDDDAAALATIGIDLHLVIAQLEQAFGPDALELAEEPSRRGLRRRRAATSRISPAFGKTLRLALREAIQLKHSFIGTEHLLLGLLRGGDDLTMTILGEIGAQPSALRAATVAALDQAA
jgi:ATP-dependent Clp protease ATP-binding subunit ClpA